MSLSRITIRVSGAALVTLLAIPAYAQVKDPKFDYGKYEKQKAVEWKASAKVGLMLATGNSQSGTAVLGGLVSRKADMNKFALEGNWNYVRSYVLQAADSNENAVIDPWEIDRRDDTTANAWLVKARYDRFFSENNAAYLTGSASGDTPAGKEFIAGGQIGYSRQLYKSARHEALLEAGYDFSYENYNAGADLNIHSLRFFTGYTLSITEQAGLFANLEALFNLSPEKVPLTIFPKADDEAGPFRDTRINFKTGLSSTFFKKLSVSITFAVKFDNVPAPLPGLKVGGKDVPYATGFTPLANKTDTLTEASLIYSFF